MKVSLPVSNQSSYGGPGILGILGVVFITLKLLGNIDWSWWYVTAPFWAIPAVLLLMFVTTMVATSFVGIGIKLFGGKPKKRK